MLIVEEFYTLQETADRLGVVRNTIWRWMQAGKVRKVRYQRIGGIVLIEKAEVERLKAERERP